MKKTFVFTCACLLFLASCNSAKPVKTIENLKSGIKGETTASAKYAAFAEKAKAEGHDTIAKLFEATSKSEGIHAANHRKALESLGEKMEDFKPSFEVKTTKENLESAIDGETYETKTMYPQFLADAKTEKAEKADKSFRWAFDTEMKHLVFYQKALTALETKTEKTLSFVYAVCPVCGNTYDFATVDEKCAFCGTVKEKFIKI
ncbi:MAG: ferritin family protein [Paludibacter sp.]|nr:ferritin family protein [Paludibacter sp.]